MRDALAGRTVADIDLATPEPPETMLAALDAAGLRTLPTGLAHGTVTALSEGRPFEITTLRRDLRTDGRHAEVAWTEDWREDAARRDFTINAMSLDQGGTLHDFFDGAADLAAGRVRFVGDAPRRIAEDYLRILRYFRFLARYGRGEPDADAVQSIAAATAGLALLSPERVWSELKRILAIPDPAVSLTLMAQLGVMRAVLPEASLPLALASGAPADPLLRLGALLAKGGAAAGAVADRLRLSTAERDRLRAMLAGPVPQPGDDDATLRRRLAEEPADVLLDRLYLAGAGESLRQRLLVTERPVFPLAGRDALALGLPPGPAVGAALAKVRQWWLDGGCTAGRDACLARLAEVIPSVPDIGS